MESQGLRPAGDGGHRAAAKGQEKGRGKGKRKGKRGQRGGGPRVSGAETVPSMGAPGQPTGRATGSTAAVDGSAASAVRMPTPPPAPPAWRQPSPGLRAPPSPLPPAGTLVVQGPGQGGVRRVHLAPREVSRSPPPTARRPRADSPHPSGERPRPGALRGRSVSPASHRFLASSERAPDHWQ